MEIKFSARCDAMLRATAGHQQKIYIGFSGGLDSTVLLHACVAAYPNLKFIPIYVNHGLQIASDNWEIHCQQFCADLGLDIIIERIITQPQKNQSIEDFARQARYSIFKKYLQPQDYLLLAHHQDDQAETVLLQLLRGAGPKGLSAMAGVHEHIWGKVLRPLLNSSRAEMIQYAHAHQLTWVEDETNHSQVFARNYLRHAIVPLLTERYPALNRCLARTAENCAEAEEALDFYTAHTLAECLDKLNRLSAIKLKAFPEGIQIAVIRLWLRQQMIRVPSKNKLKNLVNQLFTAKSDKSPCVSWKDGLSIIEIRRYRNNITCVVSSMKNINPSLSIHAELSQAIIRFRQGGEKIRLTGHTHSKSLKNWFQEQGIPPWERDKVPLYYQQDRLVAIGDWQTGDILAIAEDV